MLRWSLPALAVGVFAIVWQTKGCVRFFSVKEHSHQRQSDVGKNKLPLIQSAFICEPNPKKKLSSAGETHLPSGPRAKSAVQHASICSLQRCSLLHLGANAIFLCTAVPGRRESTEAKRDASLFSGRQTAVAQSFALSGTPGIPVSPFISGKGRRQVFQ